MRSRMLWVATCLAAASVAAVIAWALWFAPTVGGFCDFYTYNVVGGTRANMTPLPGWIESSPGSDCWYVP